MSDRQEQQLTLWEYISQKRTITKPIRLIELFAGIGAQAKALEVLGVKFEHYKICEWAYNSYCGYNAIHIKNKTDYSIGKTKEELIERIKGTSINYNEPLTSDQLKKKSIEWLRNAYNNCVATHNLINIMEVHGKDLKIVDTTVGMLSPDYKERFVAEYEQLTIRYLKLVKLLNVWSVGKLEFTPTCPREIYDIQLRGMEEYRRALIIRAQLEGIELPKVEV